MLSTFHFPFSTQKYSWRPWRPWRSWRLNKIKMTSILLSILVVIGSLALAFYLWQRLVNNAAKLKELHEELERNDRDLQRRMIEFGDAVQEKEKEN